jgi:hypothetical protein
MTARGLVVGGRPLPYGPDESTFWPCQPALEDR